jgi:hypothetical protein
VRLAAALLLAACAAPAFAAEPVWGVRGGFLRPSDGMKKYLGSPLPVLEGYADFKLREKIDLEVAVGGYSQDSLERGLATDGNVITPFQYAQRVTVLPVLATFGTGTYKEKYVIRVGAGAGLYTVFITKKLAFDNPSLDERFGQTSRETTLTAGPHLQLAGEWFFSKTVAAHFFARYAYAPVNLSLSRFLQSVQGKNINFAQSDRLRNVAGFMIGYGLAVRL